MAKKISAHHLGSHTHKMAQPQDSATAKYVQIHRPWLSEEPLYLGKTLSISSNLIWDRFIEQKTRDMPWHNIDKVPVLQSSTSKNRDRDGDKASESSVVAEKGTIADGKEQDVRSYRL